MADDKENPPVRMRKTLHPVTRLRSTSDRSELTLERQRREQQNFVARKRQEELRIRIEAERTACEAAERARQEVLQGVWLAERSADERDMDAFSDKFDRVVEQYLRQFCAAIPGFSLRPLVVPPGSRAKGLEFSFHGKTGWIQHNRKTAIVSRVSPGRRGMETAMVKIWTVEDLTTRNVGRAVKEVLGIRKRRGAVDRRN